MQIANLKHVTPAIQLSLDGEIKKIDLLRYQLEESCQLDPQSDACLQVAVHLYELIHEHTLRSADLATQEAELKSADWKYLTTIMKLLDLFRRYNDGEKQAAHRAKELFKREESNLTAFSIENQFTNTLAKIVVWLNQIAREDSSNDDDAFSVESPELF